MVRCTAQEYRGRVFNDTETLLKNTGGHSSRIQGETLQEYRGTLLKNTGGDSSMIQRETLLTAYMTKTAYMTETHTWQVPWSSTLRCAG